jgi:hypothetical protein
MKFFFLRVTFLWLVGVGCALGWWEESHMLVAQVAANFGGKGHGIKVATKLIEALDNGVLLLLS